MTFAINVPSDQLCQFEKYLGRTKSIKKFNTFNDWCSRKINSATSTNVKRAEAVTAIVAELVVALFCTIGAAFETAVDSTRLIADKWKTKTTQNAKEVYKFTAIRSLLLPVKLLAVSVGGFIVESWSIGLSHKKDFKAISPMKVPEPLTQEVKPIENIVQNAELQELSTENEKSVELPPVVNEGSQQQPSQEDKSE